MEFTSEKRELMGSVFELTLPKGKEIFFNICFDEIDRIEKKFSRFLPNSELSIANKNLNKWHEIDEEFMFLLARSLDYNQKTNGSFDITIKSNLDELGYDEKYTFSQKNVHKNFIAKIKDSLFASIKIKEKKIFLRKQIDFGGIGKGYAIDQVSEILHKFGIFDYCINGGGDILAKRLIPTETWNIALEHPDDTERAIGMIKVNGFSVAGSSSNRRKWAQHHHLINPKTGKPEHSVKATFILSKSAMNADVLSTAIFVSGFKKGVELAKDMDIEALIISKENKMFKTEGFDVELYE